MTSRFDVLIVGAGHAGAQTATHLRQRGYVGSIALLGEEPEFPYERPALSKEYLSGEREFDRLRIRPPAFWKQHNIDVLLGRRAVGVKPGGQIVTLDDGEGLEYGSLVWATGGRARRLACAGAGLEGVHVVRSRADVDQISDELDQVSRVVIIGGGYIGLEASAVLRKLGKEVVILEALDRVLARVAGSPVSSFYEATHRAQGVEVRTGIRVDHLEGDGARVTGVALTDGEVISCDLVIVGIGIIPCVEPLIEAGAEGIDGVDVDSACRTSLPSVFAIGDCAAQVNQEGSEGARARAVACARIPPPLKPD